MGNTIGAKIALDGEKEYREALKNISSEQKELRSEMQLAEAQYKENQNSLDALQQKHEILTKKIEAQTEKVTVYASAVEQAKEKQEQSGEKVSKYSEELAKAQEELDKMKSSEDASTESIMNQEAEVKNLSEKLAMSQEEYDKNTTSVNNWQTGLNIAQSQLINMQDSLGKTDSYMKEAQESTDGCATSIDNLGKSEQKAGEDTLSFGDVMKANLASDIVMEGLKKLADLAKQAGEEIFGLATSAAYYADELNTMATQTGVNTETLQALKYQEELMDVSVNTVTSSMARNIKAMDQARDGSERYASVYHDLGVSVTDSNGELRDSEDVFWEVIDALGQMDNAAERDADAMVLFGRSAQSLNTLVKEGSSGFKSMKKEAQDLGYIMSQDTLDSLNKASDAMERVQKTTETVKNEIGASLAPTLEDASDKIRDVILENEDKIVEIAEDVIPDLVDAIEGIIEHADDIIPVLEGLATGFLVFKAASGAVAIATAAMTAYKTATESATIAQVAMNVAADANPYILLASILGGLIVTIGAFVATADEVKNEYQEVIDEYEKEKNKQEECKTSREDARQSLENQTEVVQKLKEELKALNDKQSLTSTEQRRLKEITEQLNSIMPNLNLEIDEQTGYLASGNEELEKRIENQQALLYQQAYEEQMLENTKAKVEAEEALNELYDKQAVALENLAAANQAIVDLQNKGNYDESATVELQAGENVGYRVSRETANAMQEEAQTAYNLANGEISQYEEMLSGLNDEYDYLAEKCGIYTDQVNQTTQALSDFSEVEYVFGDQTVMVTQDVADSMDALSEKYAEVNEAAIESINSQLGLFDELSLESDLTAVEMAASLEKQTEALQTYQEDMIAAEALVEQGLLDEGLLGAIREMGVSGAGYLHELVNASKTDLDTLTEINDAYVANQQARTTAAATSADIEVGYTRQRNEAIASSNEALTAHAEEMRDRALEATEAAIESYTGMDAELNAKTMTTQERAIAATQDMIAQYSGAYDEIAVINEETGAAYTEMWDSTMASGQDAIESASKGMAQASATTAGAAITSANTELGIDKDGNSTQGYNIGTSYTTSMANGILAQKDNIVAAVDEVTNAALAKAEEKIAEINRKLGELSF